MFLVTTSFLMLMNMNTTEFCHVWGREINVGLRNLKEPLRNDISAPLGPRRHSEQPWELVL